MKTKHPASLYDTRLQHAVASIGELRPSKTGAFKRWLLATFMPHAYTELRARNEKLHNNLAEILEGIKDANQIIKTLDEEREEMTVLAFSLVARDDAGRWTTVFEADTRLPEEYDELLTEIAGRA